MTRSLDTTSNHSDGGATSLRVAQWATGNIGTHTLRKIIEHPRMTLVGVLVHSSDKQGRDAGELCGLDQQIGISATRDIDDILAARPDCVLYMPAVTNIDDICRLLEAGVNIATTVVEFHHLPSLAPDVRERVEDACRRGGSSLYSTGASPGFISEALPLVLTLLTRRLDRLTVNEYADMSSRDSPQMIFDLLGFGRAPRVADERHLAHLRNNFGQSFRQLTDALGIPIDTVEAHGEHALARQSVQIAAGLIEAGTVGALRFTVECRRNDQSVVRFHANWYCTTDIDAEWDLRESGWRVQVDGDTPLDVSITYPVAPELYPSVSPGFTGNPVINAVEAVCQAPPGIRTTVDLPRPTAYLG